MSTVKKMGRAAGVSQIDLTSQLVVFLVIEFLCYIVYLSFLYFLVQNLISNTLY